jgi:hypothetical protein
MAFPLVADPIFLLGLHAKAVAVSGIALFVA